jgi:hypothetical protein
VLQEQQGLEVKQAVKEKKESKEKLARQEHLEELFLEVVEVV